MRAHVGSRGELVAAAISALLLIAVGLALVPRAGAVQNGGLTYSTPTGVCTNEIVALNEPGVGVSGGGIIRSIAQSLTYSPPNHPCYSANLQPPNAIRVNQVLQKLSGSSWVYCSGTQTGDYYNTVLDWNKVITSNYGSSPVCGAGAYRGMGRGWVNGNGGALVTGAITLP